MTIKRKITLYISLFFSILFGIICVFIILNFEKFRKEEFRERLSEKALSTIRLLVDVKEVDNHLLRIIDKNSIHKLYNEKTLIFNDQFQLIYSSLDDTKIHWKKEDLGYLKKHKTFFKKDNENEIYGIFYDSHHKDYFALISANDNYGIRKLNYLTTLIVFAYIFFLILNWITTYYLIKNQLKPLDVFHKQISEINDLNIQKELVVNPKSNNEIDLISKEFNYMMSRITNVFQKQKEFTAHASHELRTPLLRLSAQVENKILQSEQFSLQDQLFLKNVLKDILQLNELINSLLILSKSDLSVDTNFDVLRLDEVLFNSIEKISKEYNDIIIDFNIEAIPEIEKLLEVKSNSNLLEIAFFNLIKNAYWYSSDKKVKIDLFKKDERIALQFSNSGNTISKEEQKNLFQPFMRGENSKQIRGLGLGLTIVYRILTNSGFKITYNSKDQENIFVIVF